LLKILKQTNIFQTVYYSLPPADGKNLLIPSPASSFGLEKWRRFSERIPKLRLNLEK
jgi:hypothetical protein